MTQRNKSSIAFALFLVVIILFPAGYLGLITILTPHPTSGLVPGFQDYSFTAWNLSANKVPGAAASAQNGILTVLASGNLTRGSILLAQRIMNTSLNLRQFRYLSVQIRTHSLGVAAKIVIWTKPNANVTLLLKTYNDSSWHTEIIDLSQFGVRSDLLYSIQLGWQLLEQQSSADASFTQLSLSALN